jgi:hypothetical protein
MTYNTGGVADDDWRQRMEARLEGVESHLEAMVPGLAALAGLDGISRGIADLVGVLEPIQELGVPQAPPEKSVIVAIDRVREALGPELVIRDPIPVPNRRIRYIGHP